MKIWLNTRTLQANLTGAQRYTGELISRLEDELAPVFPEASAGGMKGHLWEQTVLPFKVGRDLLWSPANTGPLSVRRQVVSMLDMAALDHPEWFQPEFAAWYGFLLPRLARRVRRILTISNFSKERIIERCGVEPDKVVVTHLGADRRFFRRGESEIDVCRKRYGIPGGNYVLALGSLEPRKNLTHLLRAWKQLVYELPDDIWLVVVGAKGKKTIFREAAMDAVQERVLFTGFARDEDLPVLYSGAEVFVYPSLYEGFGLPPLEAMACGTPVVVSNAASLPEVVGEAGMYVDPMDVDSIMQALREILQDDDLHSVLAQAGLARCRLFSWDKAAAVTLDVLREAA